MNSQKFDIISTVSTKPTIPPKQQHIIDPVLSNITDITNKRTEHELRIEQKQMQEQLLVMQKQYKILQSENAYLETQSYELQMQIENKKQQQNFQQNKSKSLQETYSQLKIDNQKIDREVQEAVDNVSKMLENNKKKKQQLDELLQEKAQLDIELEKHRMIRLKADIMYNQLNICDNDNYLQDVLKSLESQYNQLLNEKQLKIKLQ
ncbi:Hypothetical_protein [Hexamita inflata]|uniref:Hypothetical_protein n=1 Tax=Hexamita inflata TaxID=28002 RepID=A0AA86R3K4_9EUKA|nr:Hypothetical protein HINF_LOCUS58686 [Hexamita inflata]